jgi:hypothetical protein
MLTYAIKNHRKRGETQMFGYIVRETEAAVAFVKAPLTAQMKPLWVPRKKIAFFEELDLPSMSVDIAGESYRRMGTPVHIGVDSAFLAKVGVAE